MVKHTETIRWQEPTNCFSVLDHFVVLALKGLKKFITSSFVTNKYMEFYNIITRSSFSSKLTKQTPDNFFGHHPGQSPVQ